MSFHETLVREDETPAASDRSFGLVMAAACAVVGLWPMVAGRSPRWAAFGIGAAFLLAALARPRVLAPLNRLWMTLGRLLHRIVSPAMMALLFALVVVPTAAFLRLAGRDPLRLKLDRGAASYWQRREPPGPAPGSLTHQF
jgi:hypothetical protein